MSDLINKIEKLKKEKNAVILAHYYVNDEVQAIADFVGDSYYLAKLATTVPEETIVFCGVLFMGESAKILNCKKTVVMPDSFADCPMAHMIDAEKIKEVRNQYDDLAVVCYVNSTAEIKALSDVCVTSSNAVKIVQMFPQKNIFFIPDSNLGRHVASLIPEKNFIFHDGFCHVHTSIKKEDVLKAKSLHPQAKVLVHPECTLDVIELSDYVGSTSGIIDYATSSEADTFIICTEGGILYELGQKNPNKKFYLAGHKQFCPSMKRITLEKVVGVLENMENPIEMDETLRLEAGKALLKMLELSQ